MNFTKRESAVSPVIGTILLVAIAVVLVAIILAVVMGFSGDTNEKKVGMNAKSESGANATLILYGGASIDELVKLEMIDQGSANGSYVKLWENTDGDSGEAAFVGVPYLAVGVAQPEKDMAVYDTRINVRGTFSDGTEVILLVQPMTFYDVEGPKIPRPPSGISAYIQKVELSGGGLGTVDITDNYQNNEEPVMRKLTSAGTHPMYIQSLGWLMVEAWAVKIEAVSPRSAEFQGWKVELISDTPKTDGSYTSNAVKFTSNKGIMSLSIGRVHVGVPNAKVGNWTMTIYILGKNEEVLASEYWRIRGDADYSS